VWEKIRRALVPGGIFAGQLFGTGDSWAGDCSAAFSVSVVASLPVGVCAT
jgi:hypothetical protein